MSTIPSSLLNNVLSKLYSLGLRVPSIMASPAALATASGLIALLLRLLLRSTGPRYVDDLNRLKKEFDIIVVGGGTSGCVLAARLSEDPRIHVLLLEAGGSGVALPQSRVPALFGRLYYTKYVHQLRTDQQVNALGKKVFWPRAKLLGGCSSINAQVAQYGAPGDFDDWAEQTGDQSWAWKNFSRYFRKFESCQTNPKSQNGGATVNRGTSGPVTVGYFNTVTNASQAFVNACINLGVAECPDFNSAIAGGPGPMGVGRLMSYVNSKYRRVSSESAYLTKDVLARTNLTVAVHATVTRILFDGEAQNNALRAVGVEFGRSEGEELFTARARKEIIVSGGSIHSPHLLMVSGIGPAEPLASLNIPVLKDLPGVGDHLVDHPVVDLSFRHTGGESLDYMKRNDLRSTCKRWGQIAKYYIGGGGGALACNLGECAAFIRSDDPVLFPKSKFPATLVDSSSAKDSPDLEVLCTPLAYKAHGRASVDGPTSALHVCLLRPTSSGTLSLRSRNPWVQPSLNPNYLSTPEDVQKLVRGVRFCLTVARTPPYSNTIDSSDLTPGLDHGLHTASDAELEAFVRERVETLYHPTSTCRIGKESERGVVDSNLKVHGVRGLRVCDASVFPQIISGHTSAACYAVAEKLADMIKLEWEGA